MDTRDRSQQVAHRGPSRRTLMRGLGALVLAGATGALESTLTAAATIETVETVAVVVDDHGITFSAGVDPTLQAGTLYQFVVTNRGWVFHRFAVRDADHEPLGVIPTIAPRTT